MSDNISIASSKKDKKKQEERAKKPDPEMQLEGNRQLNQLRKKQFKKEKKERNRREKVALQLSAGLENFSLNMDESENFMNTDVNM